MTLVRPYVIDTWGERLVLSEFLLITAGSRCLYVFKQQLQQEKLHNLSFVFQQDLTAWLEAQKYIFNKNVISKAFIS